MEICVNSLNLSFQVYGAGLPLVVLHGWGDRGDNWYSFAQSLASKCQVFLVDLPGFGNSESPNTAWGVENYRDAIKGFIDELEITNPVLLGHSHGGKIASVIAVEPGYCRALVLVSSSGVDKPNAFVILKIFWFKVLKIILQLFGKSGKSILQYLRNRLGSVDYQQAGTLRDTLVKVVNYKLFSTLPDIKVPALIIWGSNDKTLNVAQSKVFQKLISNSYIRILWGASHHPQVDDTEELADIVGEFITTQCS